MGKEKNGQSFCKKDKHAPRRPISAFFFYNQERREKLKKEKPELDNKEIIKTINAEWNALSDEKKKPYLIKAEAQNKKYYLKCQQNISQDSYKSNYNNLNFDSKIKKTENEETLKMEINEIDKNLDKTIIDLKNKLKKAYEIIENQSIIINDLKNQLNISNDKIKDFKNKIDNLECNIDKNEKELNDYKSYLESKLTNIKKTKKVNVKDIMCVNFISTDQTIHKAIPCIPGNTFAEVEEKLYQFIPEYRETNNTFLAYGSPVLRFKTISENKIGDGLPVTLVTQ